MKWSIVTDSSCDLYPSLSADGQIQVTSVPFVIRVGKQEFVDDERLDLPAMLDAMEQEPSASQTACPSPQAWLARFQQADRVIALTISSQLSGSMNSALAAREIARSLDPKKQIAVLDSRSTGPELALCVEELKEQIQKGLSFDAVVSHAMQFFQRTRIAFALSSFNNLVKNGRISRLKGFVARKLGMWGIGIGSEQGTIQVTGKTRGAAGAVDKLLAQMRESGFCGGRVMISHCQNAALAAMLKRKIQEQWKNCEVGVLPTRGLCSYYAERGGLIVSY